MTKKEIPVSIIIPTFEIDKTEPTLRHLLKQEYSNKEIIIINDNPKLKIPPSLLKIIKTHKIRLINNPKNIGIAGSLNKGIKAARTNTISIFCRDYFPENNQLIKHIVEKLYSDKKIGCVGFLVVLPMRIWQNFNFSTKLLTFRRRIKQKPPGDLANFKKEVFNKVGLFDSKNFKYGGEDGDMKSRIKKAGYRAEGIKDTVIHLHYEKNSNFLKVLKKEYIYGKAHGARKRKEGIFIRIGLFDFEIRLLFIMGFIIGLFINPIISLFCFLPFFFASLIQSIKAYSQKKWIPGLILYPFAGILIFLVQTAGAIKEYMTSSTG